MASGLISRIRTPVRPAAAYIVKEVDGRPFEVFLEHEILKPLEMSGAGLLLTDDLRAQLAAGYNAEGVRVPYRHIVVRPSGALSATPRQMANFVRMLLNRGRFDGRQLVSPDSIARMERSETTLSAHMLPRYGYGLGNSSRSEHGFIFRGHKRRHAGVPRAVWVLARPRSRILPDGRGVEQQAHQTC